MPIPVTQIAGILMRVRFVHLTGRCLLTITSFLVSCDPFQEDFISEENQLIINESATDYYVVANTSIVIDLRSILTSLFTSVTMKVSTSPTRGSLSFLNEFLFKYTPGPSFVAGEDQFEIVFRGATKLRTTTITIHMTENTSDFPCSLYAMEDHAYSRPGKPVAINFLRNDRICGFKIKDVQASISINPGDGQAMITGDSIFYTSEAGFLGTDEIVYQIATGNNQAERDGSPVSYGYVRITVSDEECPFFILDSVKLDLTDDIEDILNVGECAGGYDIVVWEILTPPCVLYGYNITLISQSNLSGRVCFGRDGGFAYYPDPEKKPQNDTATFEVCVNGQCKDVVIYITREKSG